MRGLFDPDSTFSQVLSRLADLAILSILWTLCCLGVVTVGAASAALCRCAMNMARGKGGWNARAFFRYFRENFRTATPLWLVLLAMAGVLMADLWITAGAEGPFSAVIRIVAAAGLVLWTLTAVWAFPMSAHFENTLGGTLKNAFLLSVSWLPRSLGMGALWLLPLILAAVAPGVLYRMAVLWPVLLWGGTAYVCALLMKKPLASFLEPQ